ncbi:hypothetical protein [Aurantibacter sp.]|uniref:hypothetical protein n=1 Tax=Aurantibacter sp. TaxID=2807103 RepID=UPI003267CAAC
MVNTKNICSSKLVVIAICTLFFNCKDQKVQTPVDMDEPMEVTVNRPDEIIEIDQAHTQYITYQKRRVKLIQHYEDSVDLQQKGFKYVAPKEGDKDPNGNHFDVARYVYWDYKTIKNYLQYIEKEAAEAKVDISTLRFYFTNNPMEHKSAVHPRQNSIIITPTLKKNEQEYIFAIDDSDIQNIKPQLLTDDFVPISDPLKANGQTIKKEDEKAYASFIPSTNTNTVNPLPVFAARSISLNKGNSAPPPH